MSMVSWPLENIAEQEAQMLLKIAYGESEEKKLFKIKTAI